MWHVRGVVKRVLLIPLPCCSGLTWNSGRSICHRLQPYVAVVDVDVTMGQFAANLAMQHRIRGCDAVYVALAQMRNAVLITLDPEQRQRVPPGVTARTPAEELGFLQNLNN